ncbi:MAG: glycosyltransferase [Pseudomonadales bacterium]
MDGPGRTILDCAESMDPGKVRVVIGTFDGGAAANGAYASDACRRGLPVEIIHESGPLDPSIPRQIIHLIDKHQVDILHTHDARTDLFGVVVARRRPVVLVSTVHGWISNSVKARFINWLDKRLLRRMDCVIAVSEDTREKLGHSFPKARTIVIPNALRTENYLSGNDASQFRAENGFRESDVLIANIGRLSPEKGQALFLNAGEQILKRCRDARLVLIGIGQDESKLRELASRLGILAKVRFLGFVQDMRQVYPALDLVVQSSYTEGMPNVILESLLLNTPVIATAVGGTQEIIVNQQHGVLIPSGDVSALVAAMGEFLENRDRHRIMACEGGARIRKDFDHNRRVQMLKNLYSSLTGRAHESPA